MDRYWAITDPLAYPVIMTPGRAKKLIALVWSCSSIISFPAIIWWRSVSSDQESDNQCNFTDDIGYLVFSSIISFYGPLSVMIYMYYRIYKAAVEQTRSIKAGLKHIETPGLSQSAPRASDTHARTSSSTVQGFAGDGENGPVVLRIHRGGFTSLSAVLEQQQQHQQMVGKSHNRKGRSSNHKSFWSRANKSTNDQRETSMRNIAEAAATAAVAASAITAGSDANRQHLHPEQEERDKRKRFNESTTCPPEACASNDTVVASEAGGGAGGRSREGEAVAGARGAVTCSTSNAPIELGARCSVKSSSSSTTSATSAHTTGLKSPVQLSEMKKNASSYSDRSARSNLKTWSMGKKFSKLAKERKAAKTLGE